MSTRLFAALAFALLSGGVVVSLLHQRPDLTSLKARAAALQTKQERAKVEAWRITSEHPGDYDERQQALARVRWLTPEELAELGRLDQEISEREGRPLPGAAP